MSNRHWVGGYVRPEWHSQSDGTNWAATSGGQRNATTPASNDDVFFDANSGSGSVMVSQNTIVNIINLTGFTGSFRIASGVVITITNAIVIPEGFVIQADDPRSCLMVNGVPTYPFVDPNQ